MSRTLSSKKVLVVARHLANKRFRWEVRIVAGALGPGTRFHWEVLLILGFQ